MEMSKKKTMKYHVKWIVCVFVFVCVLHTSVRIGIAKHYCVRYAKGPIVMKNFIAFSLQMNYSYYYVQT